MLFIILSKKNLKANHNECAGLEDSLSLFIILSKKNLKANHNLNNMFLRQGAVVYNIVKEKSESKSQQDSSKRLNQSRCL